MAIGTASKEQLLLELMMDAKQYKAELDKVEARTATWHKKMAKGFEGAAAPMLGMMKNLKVFGTLMGALVAGAGINKLGSMVTQMGSMAKTLTMASERLGFTTSEMQKLNWMAGQMNIETRTVEMGLQRMTRRLGEAAAGFGEALPQFRKLKIELTDVHGRARKSTEVFQEVMTALSKMSNEAEQLKASFRFFDSEGVAMAVLAQHTGELAEKFDALNLIIGKEHIEAMAEAQDGVKTWGALWNKVMSDIVAGLGPLNKSLAEGAAGFYSEMTKRGDASDLFDRLQANPLDMGPTEKMALLEDLEFIRDSPGTTMRHAAGMAEKGASIGGNRGAQNALRARGAKMRELGNPDELANTVMRKIAEIHATVVKVPPPEREIENRFMTRELKRRRAEDKFRQGMRTKGEPAYLKASRDFSRFANLATSEEEMAAIPRLAKQVEDLHEKHKAALEKARKAREEAEKGSWARIGDAMEDELEGAFATLLGGGEITFKGLLNSFRQIFAKQVAQDLRALMNGEELNGTGIGKTLGFVGDTIGSVFGLGQRFFGGGGPKAPNLRSPFTGIPGDMTGGANVPMPEFPQLKLNNSSATGSTVVINNNSKVATASATSGGASGFDNRTIEVMVEDIVVGSMYQGKVNTALMEVTNLQNNGLSNGHRG